MSNVLNEYFASVFTIENTGHLPTVRKCFQGHDRNKLCSYDITTDMVKNKLRKLHVKMNKVPGVDSVGTRMLIELSDEIANFVAIIPGAARLGRRPGRLRP